MRPNITNYCIQLCSNEGGNSNSELMKHTKYLIHRGKLWGVFCKYVITAPNFMYQYSKSIASISFKTWCKCIQGVAWYSLGFPAGCQWLASDSITLYHLDGFIEVADFISHLHASFLLCMGLLKDDLSDQQPNSKIWQKIHVKCGAISELTAWCKFNSLNLLNQQKEWVIFFQDSEVLHVEYHSQEIQAQSQHRVTIMVVDGMAMLVARPSTAIVLT